MAWLECDKRTGHFKIGFRLGDRKLKRSLKTNDPDEANDALAVVDDTIRAVERGWVSIPPGVDVGRFLLSGGRLSEAPMVPQSLRLDDLFAAYFGSLPEGSLEQTTIEGMRIHERHLYRILGKSFIVSELSTADLQRYIEKRSKEPGQRGRKVTPTTVRKAIVTLRTAWNWGVERNLVSGTFPGRGLRYAKTSEKPPFQTWSEIEQQISRGGLTEAEEADLWDCLFLTLRDINGVLRHIQEHARQPWVYPAVCMAAHTGARRSELLRSRLSDIDLDGGVITIRERKRNHERTTTRRVPISPFLDGVLRTWLDNHPGSLNTFCQPPDVARSKTHRESVCPVTRDEAHDHFTRALAGSKWAVIRGWHVFRHSFCSNCAAKGVDQRLINAWVGHQTEDMVRRYRHLFPDQQQAAIQQVFGAAPQPRSSVKASKRRKGEQTVVADAL